MSSVSSISKVPVWQENIGRNEPLFKELRDKTIARIYVFDRKLDAILPNFFFQEKLDAIAASIKELFSPLKGFDDFIQSNGNGQWYLQFATFLVKLPARAVRNIIHLMYSIVKELLYAGVHPAKALTQAARYLVDLVFELTRPEVWTKIGAGVVGASAGHALVTGNPFSVIPMAIGASFTIAGLVTGPVAAALQAPEGLHFEAFKQNICLQMKELPEAVLTGFCMGLLVGGIQKFIQGNDRISQHEAEKYRGNADYVTVDSKNRIHLVWYSIDNKTDAIIGMHEHIIVPHKSGINPLTTLTGLPEAAAAFTVARHKGKNKNTGLQAIA